MPIVQLNSIKIATSVLTLSGLLALSACGGSSDHPTQPAQPPVMTTPSGHDTTIPASTSGYVDARTSQIVTDGSPPSQIFDDFTLSAGATIRTVAWQGIYCVPKAGSVGPAPTASSFTVSFYSDVAGRPNVAAPIQRTTYTVAQTGQVLEKNVSGLICISTADTTWPFYRYTVTLATPFTAVAGTKYWFSVQATTPSYAVYFGWRDGIADNNASLQLFQGVFSVTNLDRAFSLTP